MNIDTANITSGTSSLARNKPVASSSHPLNGMIRSAFEEIRAAEETAIRQVRGDGDIQGAVESILKAERVLHVSLAIRDKAVSALQDITRMSL